MCHYFSYWMRSSVCFSIELNDYSWTFYSCFIHDTCYFCVYNCNDFVVDVVVVVVDAVFVIVVVVVAIFVVVVVVITVIVSVAVGAVAVAFMIFVAVVFVIVVDEMKQISILFYEIHSA